MSDYTPKVSRARPAQNDALWAAFKDSSYDLLFSAQGIGASASQGVLRGMLLCEKLEGTLVQFAALRDNSFMGKRCSFRTIFPESVIPEPEVLVSTILFT